MSSVHYNMALLSKGNSLHIIAGGMFKLCKKICKRRCYLEMDLKDTYLKMLSVSFTHHIYEPQGTSSTFVIFPTTLLYKHCNDDGD